MIIAILFSLFNTSDCKTVILQKNEVAPCIWYLISEKAAKEAFDIIENLYPKAVQKSQLLENKVDLLNQQLKLDEGLIENLKTSVGLYEKKVQDLITFSKDAVMHADKMQKGQTYIMLVSVGVTIVLMIGTMLVVGYLVQSFTKWKNQFIKKM